MRKKEGKAGFLLKTKKGNIFLFKRKHGKQGVSPMISTILLIMMVIIIAIIILLWSRGFVKEKLLKFDKVVDNVCLEIALETYVNPDNTIGLRNKGIVPIQEVKLKINRGGNEVIENIGEDKGGKVGPGLSNTIQGYTYSPDAEIKVIPVIIGKTKSGAVKTFTCPEETGVVV